MKFFMGYTAVIITATLFWVTSIAFAGPDPAPAAKGCKVTLQPGHYVCDGILKKDGTLVWKNCKFVPKKRQR